jgi:hypothetical protein
MLNVLIKFTKVIKFIPLHNILKNIISNVRHENKELLSVRYMEDFAGFSSYDP